MIWLVPLLAACGRNEPFTGPARAPTPEFVDPGLTTTGATAMIDLGRAPGRFTFPQTVMPAGFEPSARFPIALDPEPVKVRKATTLYRADSPFYVVVEEEGRVSGPPGMQLFANDQRLPYSPKSEGESWRITEEALFVAVKGAPPKVSVLYPTLADEIRRRDFPTSTLDPDSFARFAVTLGTRTRHGLLLPAPSIAEWDVTLPAAARFEAWTALAPLQLKQLASTGATVELSVKAAGGAEITERTTLSPGMDFVPWRVDLSRLGGQAVTVTLRTDPAGDPAWDYVFLGTPQIWGDPTGEVRHVVVIGIDTTRPDHFGFYGYPKNTTPELDQVAASSVVFDHTWAPAPRTRPSFRSAFTGRRPLDAVGATNIAEVFAAHGFLTAGVVANVHLQPKFEFDEGFGDWWYDQQAKANEQVDRAIDFLAAHQDRDTYLFLHLMDPHLFYDAPGSMKDMFTEQADPDLPDVFNRWEVYDWMRTKALDEVRKKQIAARYDGELRYTSQELGRLFAAIDRMPGRNLVVLHSDHGEELFEHDAFEHNHSLHEETLRVLLWFRANGGQTAGKRISTPVSLEDIAPTLFDFAGFTDTPPTDGRSLKGLILGTDDGASFAERALDVGHLRYNREAWGVVWKGQKYVVRTASGQEQLYDLVDDPRETTDIAATTDLAPFRAAAAQAHGMQIGRGWRVKIDLHGEVARGEYQITLPRAPIAFGVTDPEASLEVPANQAWGELPSRVPADVATVSLGEDGRALRIVPGPKASDGLLYVLFGEDLDVNSANILHDGHPLMTIAAGGRVAWRAGRESIVVEPGTIVIPPVDEVTRMRAIDAAPMTLDENERKQLCELGYLQCDHDSDSPEPSGE